MPEPYDPVDVLTNAIFGQESNWNPDARTSVTGARGIGQIQPQTFAQYALPGENINNPADNAAVGRRIISYLYSRYGFDPARIATAYFSGPKNVSTKNSATPYIQDRADPTGKRISSYVTDVVKRVGKLAQAGQDQPVSASDILSAFEQTSKAPAKNGTISGDDILTQFKATAPPPSPNGSRIPVPPENMTPAQLQEYKASLQRGAEGAPYWITQNYHPLAVIPQTFGEGAKQITQGLADITANRPASAVGNLGMGALTATAGALFSPLSETLRAGGQAIGQPQAADVANLVMPIKGVGAAVSPTIRATGDVIKLVGEKNIPEVLRRLEQNPNLSLMDVSQPVKTIATGLANSPNNPEAQSLLRKSYEARTADRQDIVQKAMDQTLGPKIDVKEYLDQLKENVRKVGEQRINPAIADAQPIGVMPLVQRLDKVINAKGTPNETISRLSKLKDQITEEAGTDGFIDPKKLHGIQWRLRAEAENLAKSASGADRNLAGPLFNARNDMVDAIDNASGGKYKPALAGFRSESQVQDAFDKGFNIFKTGGVEDFPEYWNAWVKEAQPAEIAAAKVGAITAARREIEGMKGGARRGETILGPTFNQDKISALFGPQQTAQLSSLLKDAMDMSETNSLLYQNSKTEMTRAGREYFEPRKVGGTGPLGIGAGLAGSMLLAGGATEPGLLGLGLGAAKVGHTGLQYIGSLLDKKRATKFAELASATGEERNKLLGLLRNASTSGNKASNLIPSLVRLAAP